MKYKNVNFKVVGFTLLGSLVGMAAATYLIGELLPTTTVKQYISIMAIIMGLFVVVRSYLTHKIQKPSDKHKWAFPLLGAVIGFNKGGSGGNYGPISVTGYMLLGLSAATAIGTTTVAEGIACLLGVALYIQIAAIVLSVTIPITIGAFIADPISAWINNHLKKKLTPPFHGRLIGLAMMFVGFVSLLKALGFLG